MIYNEVTRIDFQDSKVLRDVFSYEAINELFEWASEISNISQDGMEFDPVAITCDWSEYNETDLFTDYGYLLDDDERQELYNLIEILENKTTVIKLKTTYLIEAF